MRKSKSNSPNQGELRAWHYASRSPVRLAWRDGTITSLDATDAKPPGNLWLAPALFDLQINGYGGVDFQKDHLTAEDLLKAIRQLRARGCAQFLLTLITDDWPRMKSRLRHLRRLRQDHPEIRQAIAGWHWEGPFLSPEPGFCGAHNPAVMMPAKPEHVREIRKLTGQDPVLLTLSPTTQTAIAAIELATSLGMKISLGHTNASHRWLRRAVKAGATGFTHLGNGCPPILDRRDNILWRVLDNAELTVSLIPDQIHVSPPLFRLIHRVLDSSQIYYTSDAIAAAGLPPGRYTLGRLELEVGKDKVVRLPGTGNLAGSAISPFEAVCHAAKMLRCDWQETWKRLSDAPRRFMGLPTDFAVGTSADFCIVKATPKGLPELVQVFSAGKAV